MGAGGGERDNRDNCDKQRRKGDREMETGWEESARSGAAARRGNHERGKEDGRGRQKREKCGRGRKIGRDGSERMRKRGAIWACGGGGAGSERGSGGGDGWSLNVGHLQILKQRCVVAKMAMFYSISWMREGRSRGERGHEWHEKGEENGAVESGILACAGWSGIEG